MTIFVTGGAGYIGSHTCLRLLENGYEVIASDNLCNSSRESLNRVEKITGKTLTFYEADMRDREAVNAIFDRHSIDCVIHFAGLKAVGDSMKNPLGYYENNLCSTMVLLDAMRTHGCKKIIFSSSATVYSKGISPFTETDPAGDCINPYGWTKFIIEQMLRDFCAANPDFSAVMLRYFNPIGAHPSGLIGEDPNAIPANLMPYICQVAVGRLKELSVYGNDYDTPDGTGVRDYIHVMDIAQGHVAAIDYLEEHTGAEIFNLGTGRGYSVLEIVNAFERVNGVRVPYIIGPRRAGDAASVYASPEKSERLLKWKATLTLEDMCRDAWNWQKNNPQGY